MHLHRCSSEWRELLVFVFLRLPRLLTGSRNDKIFRANPPYYKYHFGGFKTRTRPTTIRRRSPVSRQSSTYHLSAMSCQLLSFTFEL